MHHIEDHLTQLCGRDHLGLLVQRQILNMEQLFQNFRPGGRGADSARPLIWERSSSSSMSCPAFSNGQDHGPGIIPLGGARSPPPGSQTFPTGRTLPFLSPDSTFRNAASQGNLLLLLVFLLTSGSGEARPPSDIPSSRQHPEAGEERFLSHPGHQGNPSGTRQADKKYSGNAGR